MCNPARNNSYAHNKEQIFMKSGSVKQVAAFGKLVGICNDLGASYNPSKAALMPTALVTLLEQAQQNLEAVNVARANFVLAINARQESYAGIYKLVSRVVRAVTSTESSRENIRDARMLRHMLAPNSTAKKTSAAAVGETPGTVRVSNSSSRLDYDGQADTLARLINLVQGMPSYAPNETDLQVVSLKAMHSDLKMKSLIVANTANTLANARISRNRVLFGKEGMFETGTSVKEYIRSVFGVRSEPAKELGKLRLAA